MTAEGYVVDPGIVIPQGAESVVINNNGQVQVRLAGEPDAQIVGQLELATFYNEAGLEAVGENYFLETAASGPATIGIPGDQGFGTLRQGFVEAANVNPVAEITALIQAQRAYEMNARVITASDEMLATSSQLR